MVFFLRGQVGTRSRRISLAPSSMITSSLLPGMDGTGMFFEDFAAAISRNSPGHR